MKKTTFTTLSLSILFFLLSLPLHMGAPCAWAAEPVLQAFLLHRPNTSAANYHLKLLDLALSKCGVEYRLDIAPVESSQARRIQLVKESAENLILPVGTSPQLEEELLPVRIPALLGIGVGYRIMFANHNSYDELKSVRSLIDLQKFTFVQGMGWSDIPILENAGLKIKTAYKFELLYKLVNSERADLFPRGLFEIYGEYESRKTKYKNLVIDDSVLITYPFATLYFVRRDNKELHDALYKGLVAAYESGEFQDLIMQDPTRGPAINRADLGNRVRFDLPQYNVTDETMRAIKRFRFIPDKPIGVAPGDL